MVLNNASNFFCWSQFNYTYLFSHNCALQCVVEKLRKSKEHNNEAKDLLLNVLHILCPTNKRKTNEKKSDIFFASSTSSKNKPHININSKAYSALTSLKKTVLRS